MAITLDATSTGATPTTGLTTTVSHVCAAGAVLYVLVAIRHGADLMTGVTYNGSALTQVAYIGGSVHNYIYRITAPSTGTHDIVVTYSSAVDRAKHVSGISLLGVDTTTPEDVTGTLQPTSSPSTINLTTTTDDTVLLDSFVANETNTMTEGSGQTVISKGSVAGATYSNTHGQSYKLTTGAAGSYAMSWSWTGTGQYSHCAVAVNAAPVSANNEVASIAGISNV